MRGRLLLIIILGASLAGCATTGSQKDDNQIRELQTQNAKLRDELLRKDDEIAYLEEQLEEGRDLRQAPAKGSKLRGGNAPLSHKEIQTALKKAGFYKGSVDGKIGAETKRAIKKFQEANGLTSDGIAGKETRVKLKKYLK